MHKIRIVLIDDHALVRRGLRSTLDPEPDLEVVGEAGEAEQALRVVKETKPDIVLLDLQLPGASGPELCWRVTEASPSSAVLILTAFLNPHLLKACMLGGSRGYLLKDAENLDLPAMVRAAYAGTTVFDPRVADVVNALLREPDSMRGALSLRELQVLKLMSEGLTNKEIGERLFISLNTVKGYVKEIMNKLDSRSRVEVVVEARARNLI